MRHVALITDAVDAGAYFPAWLRYYSTFIEVGDIYVCAYGDEPPPFEGIPEDHVLRGGPSYNDAVRTILIGDAVAALLKGYRWVIRVDVDEFLVPDLRRYRDLAEFVERLDEPYVTSRGFDLFHVPGEPRLDLGRPILSQRRHAYPNNALNKTAITSVPLRWSRGFHGCDRPPRIGPIFLPHAKRASIDDQAAWNGRVRTLVSADPHAFAYYSESTEDIMRRHDGISRRPVLEGPDALYRAAHIRRFEDEIHEDAGLLVSNFDLEDILVRLPDWLPAIF